MKNNDCLAFQSFFTFNKSAITFHDAINFAKKNDYSSLALTDDNTYGHLTFYKKCLENNLQPILGVILKNDNFEIIIYSKNNQGLEKLNFLVTFFNNHKNCSFNFFFNSNKDNFDLDNIFIFQKINFFVSKSDLQFLKKLDFYFLDKNFFQKNLTLKSRFLEWPICNYLNLNNYFLMMMQKAIHNNKEQSVNLLQLAKKPINIRKLKPTSIHSKLLNISYTFSDQNKTPIIKNSQEKIIKICQHNLQSRFRQNVLFNKYKAILDRELKVVIENKFADYFLIVADFVGYAKKNKICVGLGRGSANSSLIAYLLNISNIDPVFHKLNFERFLSLKQKKLPDIDVDISSDKKHLMFNYLQEKYHFNNVGQITTFAKNSFKTSLIKLVNILSLKKLKDKTFLSSFQKIIKIPNLNLNNKNYNIDQFINQYPFMQNIFQYANGLSKLYTHESVHAAGVIISNDSLFHFGSFRKVNKYNVINVNINDLENYGFVKFDLLSLNTLDFVQEIINNINNKKENFSLTWPLTTNLNDPKIYKMLFYQLTSNIFQIESYGMRQVLQQIQISSFHDLVAAISLYRPGTKKFISQYALRKKEDKQNIYLSSIIDEILNPTYGIILYQEQLMKLLQILLNCDSNDALGYVKSLAKKQNISQEIFQKFQQNRNLPINQKLAQKLLQDIIMFAEYGFNKAHAVGYALLIYQIAFLKLYFFVDFYKYLLDIHFSDKTTLKILKTEIQHHFFNNKVCNFDWYLSDFQTAHVDQTFYLGYHQFTNNVELVKKIKLVLNSQFDPFNHFIDLEKFFLDLKGINELDAKNFFIKINQNLLFYINQVQATKLYKSCYQQKHYLFPWSNDPSKVAIINIEMHKFQKQTDLDQKNLLSKIIFELLLDN